MISLIRGEIFKLKRCTALKVLIGFSVIVNIVLSIVNITIINSGQILPDKNFLDIIREGIGNFEIYWGMIAIISGVFIAKELDNKAWNLSFTYGYSREQVLLSKIIAFMIGVLIFIFIDVICSVVELVTEYNIYFEFTKNNVLELFKILGVGVLAIITISIVSATIAIITKSIVITIAIPIIIPLMQEFLWGIFEGGTNIVTRIQIYPPFGYESVRNSMEVPTDSTKILTSIILLSFIITIFIIISILVTRKRDLN